MHVSKAKQMEEMLMQKESPDRRALRYGKDHRAKGTNAMTGGLFAPELR